MSDSDLFMECEEEDLEPWQQIDDKVQEEEVALEEKTKASTAPPAGKAAAAARPSPDSVAMADSRASTSSHSKGPKVTGLTDGTVATTTPTSTPATAPPAPTPPPPPPVLTPVMLPSLAPQQQLILAQGPASLGSVPHLLHHMPVVSTGQTGGVAGQPVIFTTQDPTQTQTPVRPLTPDSLGLQGYQLQTPVAGHNTISPVGFLLNGQTVTLLPAPGNPFFKSVVAEALSQRSMGQTTGTPGTAAPGKPAQTTATPATATPAMATSATATQAAATEATAKGTHQTSVKPQHLFSSFKLKRPAPSATQSTKIAPRLLSPAPPAVAQSKTDMQPFNPKVKKLIKAVNVASSRMETQLKAKASAIDRKPATAHSPSIRAVAPPKTLWANKMCPRCGSQYRVVEALRGHVCYCSPELTKGLQAMGKAGAANVRPPPTVTAPSATSKAVTPKTATAAARPGRSSTAISPPPSSLPSPPPSQTEEGEPEIQGKLIMLVDDFYYGQDDGRGELESWDPAQQGPVQFRCITCDKKLKNNIRLMNHMKHHIDLEQQSGEVDTHTSCQHCYRNFPTPFRLQCHLENVHSQYESTTKCKICEWAFENEPVFLQHMKSTHSPGEMPYLCQVCEYRSSLYSDVFSHFRNSHKDTVNLLCPYCLKVFRSNSNYQHHYIRHQKKSVFQCDKCRLQFLSTRDKMEHKLHHHKTFRKPHQLEGLKPGTKVTIRAYAIQTKPVGVMYSSQLGGTTTAAAANYESSAPATPSRDSKGEPRKPPAMKRKPTCSMQELMNRFQEDRETLGKQSCLECNFDIPDFPNHFPTYVNCSLCQYCTCCSRAYANHMINNHVSRKTSTKYLALYKAGPRWAELTCTSCSFTTQVGDEMARHLLKNPSHSSSMCSGPPGPLRGQTAQSQAPTTSSQATTQPSQATSKPSQATTKPSQATTKPSQATTKPSQATTKPSQATTKPSQAPATPSQTNKGAGGDTSEATEEQAVVLTVGQLQVLLFALCCGVPRAAGHFFTQPQLIWSWLLEREKSLGLEGGANSGGRPRGGVRGAVERPEAERLREWLLLRREQQFPVTDKSLFTEALRLFGDRGAVSYKWAVDFLLRHRLGVHATGTVGRPLSSRAEESARVFISFVREHTRGLPLSAVGVVDELSVFVDFKQLVKQVAVSREAAFQLAGFGEPLCNIFLSALADGTVLPALVFFRGQVPERLRAQLPGTVVLEARPMGIPEVEQLRTWASQVWGKGVGPKALLVMDSHRGHSLESFQGSLRAAGTYPAVVPPGCSFRLQPLEVCVGPALRGFLEARWSQLVAERGTEGAKPADLLRMILGWLAGALEGLGGMPDLLRRSFRIAGTIPAEEGDGDPAEVQMELVRSLTEVLMRQKSSGPAGLEMTTTTLIPTQSVMTTDKRDGGKQQVAEEESVLDTSTESSATSPHWPPLTANPQALRQVFEKDSDVESFLGFEESEISAVIGQSL